MIRDRATEYARRVVDGEILTGEPVRLACQRHLDDLASGAQRGLRWDVDEAERAVHFMELLPHIKGEWARRGERLHMELWQAFVVGSIFGWKREDGTRRFRMAYEEVARKNAKSTKVSGVGIRMAFFDNEPGAEVYAAATKLDQAKIVWNDAKAMVQKSTGLRSRIKAYALALAREAMSQKFVPIGSDRNTLDGLNSHCNLVDELHAHRTRDLWEVLDTAMGARLQPLQYAITTAGYDRQSICWEVRGYGLSVLRGEVADDAFFAYIATLDDGDDPFDLDVLAKANPNLIGSPGVDGGSVYREYLATQAKRARELPGKLNGYLRLHCNVWTEQAQRWIDVAAWNRSARRSVDVDLEGRPCFAGLDLTSTTDLGAYVLLFPPLDEDEDWQVLYRFYSPREHPESRSKQERDRFDAWERAGLLTYTDGNVVDYETIRADVNEDAERYDIQEVAYDPWNAMGIVPGLMSDGATCVPVRPTFAGLSSACKRFEEIIIAERIRDGGNPIMRWMVGNVSVLTDRDGNMRPSRDKQTDKIDGVAALLTALARAELFYGDDYAASGPSVYVFDEGDFDDND